MTTREDKSTFVPASSVPARASTADLIELLAQMRQGDSLAADGPRLGWMKSAARALITIAAVLLLAAVAMAVAANVVGPQHVSWLASAARLSSKLSVAAVLIAVAVGTVVLSIQVVFAIRREPQLMRAELDHDERLVRNLVLFDSYVLEDADHWLGLKRKRLQRRLVRFFGSNDKIAFVVVIAAAWSSWKDLAPMVNGTAPSPFTFVAAFVAGLAIGGMTIARRLDQIAFQLDLIEMARRAQAKPKQAAASTLTRSEDVSQIEHVAG